MQNYTLSALFVKIRVFLVLLGARLLRVVLLAQRLERVPGGRAARALLPARSFPEGTRSKAGRIADCKKGPFTMASRAGVRIVPISIIGTHLFQPPGAFVPVARPRGVRIVCHPPLDAPAEKKEDESLKAAKAAIISALPPSMKPLEA